MCQQHMKRWCNNVDWSLESGLLNINNGGGDSKRVGLGTHSLIQRDLGWGPTLWRFKEIWVGDPLFKYFEEGHFLF